MARVVGFERCASFHASSIPFPRRAMVGDSHKFERSIIVGDEQEHALGPVLFEPGLCELLALLRLAREEQAGEQVVGGGGPEVALPAVPTAKE